MSAASSMETDGFPVTILSHPPALVMEVLAQQERWVALMMGLHARLGAKSMLVRYGGLPAEVWQLVCVDALGVNIVVNLDDGSGSTQQMRGYSALKEVPVNQVLRPLFDEAGLNLSSFVLSIEGEPLNQYGKMAEQCWINERTSTTKIMARPCGPHEVIILKVKGQDGHIVEFKMRRQARLGKLFEAYCRHQDVQLDQVRFVLRGFSLRAFGHQTPGVLGFCNDDIIDSTIVQVGD